MRIIDPKVCASLALLIAPILLMEATPASAQQQVSLTAAPASTTLPDGQAVPMWGYTCGTSLSSVLSTATCSALNASAAWSPVLITVPTGQDLQINLTNSLSFATGSGTNTVPTSLIVVGQVGGGLGSSPTNVASPDHSSPQGITWPVANTGNTFTPPPQPQRVQSFATEVASGATTALTWTGLKPGTYLIESGTHPSIQVAMGLYGILVVTTPPVLPTLPVVGVQGTAYPAVGNNPAVQYDADVPMLLSEIDPVQNHAVDNAVHTAGFAETKVWSGHPDGCGNPASSSYQTCYPPAVNYSPLYYLVNGISLDRTNTLRSSFPVTAPPAIGQVLVRFVNAGSRMHVPSIVGATTGASSTPGFALIAEDGNTLPGVSRVQSEVFLAAGKTYDVMINAPGIGAAALPVFDRALSLSTNNHRDGGMQAYISVNGGSVPSPSAGAVANPDSYMVTGTNPLIVSDPSKGVIANDINVYGVAASSATSAGGTVALNANGTFTYNPPSNFTSDSFNYCGNGATGGQLCTTVSLGAAPIEGATGITLPDSSFSATVATKMIISRPGVLAMAKDAAGYPLSVEAATVTPVAGPSGLSVVMSADGSFNATTNGPGTYQFTFKAKNSQGTESANAATVTLNFPAGSGLTVNVVDAQTSTAITDYRWIIEEDRTVPIDPNAVNSGSSTPVPSLGANFHTSYMPVVASGCVGSISCEQGQTLQGNAVNCEYDNGVCKNTADQQTPLDPATVSLDPTKRYYISILPGDAGNSFSGGGGVPQPVDPKNPSKGLRPFSIAQDCGTFGDPAKANNWNPGSGKCGHGMGGSPIAKGQTSVNITLEETPFPTGKVAVFVFEDDSPLNGENDVHGGTDVRGSAREPGLGGFEIRLFDDAGGPGDATGQVTYDMFNMPLSNSLANTKDQLTGFNACPISSNPDGLVGVITTCPYYESDGKTVSPLVGQAVISNLFPGRYGVVADAGADRISQGEEWLQTNTLDGQKAHDSFIKIGGPAYFQEFGPAGFHVSIGFANPKIINNRLTDVCAVPGANCSNSLSGMVTNMHQSRTPDQRLYSTGNRDALGFTQCYVSLGDPDDDDFAFTKCDADGKFSFSGLPDGDWRITIFDQWNDQIVDGLSTPVRLAGGKAVYMEIPVQQWHTNVYTSTYFDTNGNGVRDSNEPGLALASTNVRFRDGSYSNLNNTDLNGYASFNEEFPLFNWYVLDTDTTRYKQTGVHVVYDSGGPVDNNGGATSTIASSLADTKESNSLPADLRFPGSVYCGNADCSDIPTGIQAGPSASSSSPSTGRIDPPWVVTEGWQGFIGESEFVEFGKTPFKTGENGGIHGEVVYASTRPFDNPQLLIHAKWTPNVPGVTVNLYQEGTAPDGTQSLKLVDTTVSSSWDGWSQGVRGDGKPNMNCPGQDPGSLYFFTLKNSTQSQNPGATLPYNSQYKCYDGLSNFNQVVPAPYDGMYKFPSVTARDSVAGTETGTNCSICVKNPSGDGTNMLPDGKYVVEMVVPPGYELVKEEDKNILIGDNYIAPVIQQFGGIGDIFILPDQAEIAELYNQYNPQNPTDSLGRTSFPSTEGDTGSVEVFWPCVGQARVVPDFISLFPKSHEVAPFAGATRNLCDRKEVTLGDQSSALAKFWIFSSTHVAAHFTGIMLDDLSSEFDPFSPQFGEKFAIPNVPISFKDQNGVEVSRTYSDQWGLFNGLNYSTWEVNPPNPTGYAPTMMVACMNDPGPIAGPNGTMINDPLYNPNYSQFCYEIPFMPGQTQYMDTPVVPTAAYAEGYNVPDCSYPDATPSISTVTGDSSGGGAGPWVSAAGNTLTIKALGDQSVPNQAYSGPSAKNAPYNLKFITRHYGFGNQCTTVTGAAGCTAASTVTIGGVNATINSWSDGQIVVAVPTGIPSCSANGAAQQRNGTAGAVYSASCGELVVTAGNGKQSIDTVTVTVGGKAPTYIAGENSSNNAIQNAIDQATPGDLIMVGPGNYNEMLLMWKPVRLQGVGAASVTVNANSHPSGKMDAWRQKVDCLFGLSLDGGAISSTNPFDPSGNSNCSFVQASGLSVPQVDPIPLEPVAGWDPNLNGNIAELLQEPALMGAYEGAAITVLGKGVRGVSVNGVQQYDPNCTDNAVCTALTNSNADCNSYPSNFLCNPSRVDGLSVINSSQGGGGIFLHGWNHFTEVSNNRVHSNGGTLSGGITVGQPETPDGTITGTQEAAFGLDKNVSIHNNAVTQNVAYGDELNSTTSMAAGGVTFCTGSDNYKFNYNWVCGNLSTGDGGGFVHFGLSYNATISNNWFLFNQTNNITIPTHGGGIAVVGAPPDGPACENGAIDKDCPPALSDGTGPGMVIDSNLIVGNSAESGSGGGIRLQSVNGTEVARNPLSPGFWYDITISNNIIANNVAGWDGGGVSMQDALRVKFINNTIASNDTTASSGVLFNTLGAPNANTPPPTNGGGNCDPTTNPTCAGNQIVTSTPQAAGLVTMQNTPNLNSSFPATINCPIGNSSGLGATQAVPNGDCRNYSYPMLRNDLFWKNRTFNIQVGGLGTGPLSQQNLVTLLPQLNQASTGQCVSGASYWDIGVRGDTGPSNHSSGVKLNPTYSILTDAADYTGLGTNNQGADPALAQQYCNGSRVPPENGGMGYAVPPGISDATTPNPIFNLTPAATVDEGNNWINLSFGPLSLNAPSGSALGSYAITSTSPAINKASSNSAPNHDFFGTARPQNGGFDIGAVEFVLPKITTAAVSPSPLSFGNVAIGSNPAPQMLTLRNTGGASLTGTTIVVTGPFHRPAGTAGGTCNPTLIAASSCTVNIVFAPVAPGPSTGAVTISGNALVTGSPVTLAGIGTPPVAVASITGGPLSFGSVVDGTVSAAQTLTLHNTGTASFTGIAGAFSTPPRFSRPAGAAGGTCGATLAAGATCTFKVVFSPKAPPANMTGSFTIRGNVPVSGSPVSLSSTGVAPGTVSVTSTPLSFGNVAVPSNLATGPKRIAQTLTLRNSGGNNLTGINILVTAPFSRLTGVAGGTCTATLNANSSCTINIVFSPVAQGSSTGSVTITGSAPVTGSPVTVTGTGIPPVAVASVTGGPLSFGNVVDGTVSAAQTLTLHNTGTASLTHIAGAFSSPPRFSRPAGAAGGTCGAALAAGATCTFNVVFSPKAPPGNVTGTLTVTGNVPVSGSPVSLSGAGVAP